MASAAKPTVLIVDDVEGFRDAIARLLRMDRYSVETCDSVEMAVQHLKEAAAPTFILTDRQFGGELIEDGGLETLCRACPKAFVVVYTVVGELTAREIFQIRCKGAIRVLNKGDAEKFLQDIDILTRELDALLAISHELQTAREARSLVTDALVGSNVGISIIDRAYHCWFVNETQERLTGCPFRPGIYLALFQGLNTSYGPRWGCTVTKAIASGSRVDRMKLARFCDGRLKWVLVQAIPMLKTGLEKSVEPSKNAEPPPVLAVRESMVEIGEEALNQLPLPDRLQKIAEGLVNLGLGRVRIYRVQEEKLLCLEAAAAASDDAFDTQSAYRQKELSNFVPYDLNECPYCREAVRRRIGFLVENWSIGHSSLAEALNLRLPYFIVPVWKEDGSLVAVIEADFVGAPSEVSGDGEKAIREQMLQELLRDDVAEVRRAFRAAHGDVHQSKRLEKVEQAKLRVGSALSHDEAVDVLREALADILPECRVSVCVRWPDGSLREYDRLCLGVKSGEIPSVIRADDKKSLAAHAVKNHRSIWIDDYPAYKEQASELGEPEGYGNSAIVRSTAALPLAMGKTVFGCVIIDSPQALAWHKDRHSSLLLNLMDLVTLVLRDLALLDPLEKSLQIQSELGRMDEALVKLRDIPLMCEIIVATICKITNAASGHIRIPEGEGTSRRLVLYGGVGTYSKLADREIPSEQVDGLPRKYRRSGSIRCLARGEPYIDWDAQQDPDWLAFIDRKARNSEDRAALQRIKNFGSFPMVTASAEDPKVGALCLQSEDRDFFTPSIVTLVMDITRRASLYIRNAQLFTTERRRAKQLEALRDVERQLAVRALRLDDLLKGVVEHLANLTHAVSCVLYLEENGVLAKRKWMGFVGEQAPMKLNAEDGHYSQTATVRAFVSGKPQTQSTPNQEETQRALSQVLGYRPEDQLAQIGSWLSVPLMVEDQTIGAMTAFFAKCEDITSEKTELASDFARQVAIAVHNARLVEARNELLRSISHQLVMPLQSVRGYSRLLLERGDKDDKERHALGIIYKQTEHFIRNVEDLHVLAKGAELEPRSEKIDVHSLLVHTVVLSTIEAQSKGIDLGLDLPRELQAKGDKDWLFQVLGNLLHNAVLYSNPNTSITVKAWAGRDMVTIVVKDRGWGIPGDEQAKVLERGFRGSRARVEYPRAHDKNRQASGKPTFFVTEYLVR